MGTPPAQLSFVLALLEPAQTTPSLILVSRACPGQLFGLGHGQMCRSLFPSHKETELQA